MTLVRWQATVQDEFGNVVVNPTITVRNHSDNSLAALFDDAGSSITNPFTGGTDGFVSFNARAGKYIIEGAKGSDEAPDWIVDLSPAFDTIYTQTDAQLASVVIPAGATVIQRIPSASSAGQAAPVNTLTWWRRITGPTSEPFFTSSGGAIWIQTGLREQDVLGQIQTGIAAAITSTGWASSAGRPVGAGGLNSTTATGAYSFPSTDANAPVAATAGAVIVMRVSASIVIQWAMQSADPGNLWSRRSTNNGSTWSAWARHLGDTAVELTAADNLDALERSGFYYNPTSVNTTGNNYPISSAGALLNLRRTPTNWTQRFTTFAGTVATAGGVRIFERSRGTDAWSPWVEIFHQGSLLGPVSQSGGVPTGRVIQRGTNANGEFVRFADGTLICTHRVTPSIAIDQAFLGGFRSAAQTWTYPSAFAAAPVVHVQAANLTAAGGVSANTPGTTSAQWAVTAFATQTAATREVSLTAIGRWF